MLTCVFLSFITINHDPRLRGEKILPGTPGNRFAENTVNGSVKVCARTGEMSVWTLVEPYSGAGGLNKM